MTPTLDAVRDVLIDTLELPQAPDDLQRETPLFGALPELDSFGVVQLVAAIEDRFDITSTTTSSEPTSSRPWERSARSSNRRSAPIRRVVAGARRRRCHQLTSVSSL